VNWSDERYVRVYTRDTPEWLALSFTAQGLFLLLLRKVDRSGVLPLGKLGRRAVAVVVNHPGEWPRLEPALNELAADGCIEIHGSVLVIPNFIAAQESVMSGAQRSREWRERGREERKAAALRGDAPSRPGDGTSTGGDAASRSVTPCDPSLPSLAEPSEKKQEHVADAPCLPLKSKSKKAKKVGQKQVQPDPRHKELSKAMEADFLTTRRTPYGHAGAKDAAAVTRLLELGTQAAGRDAAAYEVRRRWRQGLALGSKWPGCSTFSELASKWNNLTDAAASGAAAPSSFDGAGGFKDFGGAP